MPTYQPADGQPIRPQIDTNFFQERAGVLRVGGLLNAARLVFRETPNADVGIDGQVELVDAFGGATGATIAVQIKSGASYLVDGGECWRFYPAEKHRTYWEGYPLPVVILLHDPTNDVVYWADVRHQLRSDQYKDRFLSVPKRNVLEAVSRANLFESCGTSGCGLLRVPDVLKHMTLAINPNGSFCLSYLDIFLEGLNDIGRKIFFSAGMCWDLAESRIPPDAPTGAGMGGSEEFFLDGYIRFLVEQDLARVDYADYLIDIRDRQMYPTFLVPLTSRGRAVRDLCRTIVGNSMRPGAITEAPVSLTDGPHLDRRRVANLEVAMGVMRHFNPSIQRQG